MRQLLVVMAGLFWAAVLFLLTLFVTFPGDAVAERVEYQVGQGSKGAYALDLGSVGPWWLGLSTDSVKLYTRERRGQNADKLTLIATDARMAAGLFSLMSREPRVSGSITLGLDGTLDYVVGTSMDEKGKKLEVTEVKLNGQGFPLSELLALVPSAQMDANGKVDIEVDLDAPGGLSKADGVVDIRGSGLTLVDPTIMDFPLGRDVQIGEIELKLDSDEGRARIDRGNIESDVANLRITGDIDLNDDFMRSNLNLTIELELDESMAMLSSMLKSAEKNGKYVYECKGPLMSFERICRPAGTNRRADARRARPRPTPGAKRAAPAASDEERDERRKELQERLKKRREQRRAERANGGGPKRPGDQDPVDEELDEEEYDDEELPLDEEELPLDEEDLPPEDDEFFEE